MTNTQQIISKILVHQGDFYAVGERGVTKIIDKSLEFENSMCTLYEIHTKYGLQTRLENVPVIVSYGVSKEGK